MNYLSPFTKQILVASAPQLAALSVGGVVGYPNVLIEQFKSNDNSIHVDLNIASWFGSIHGLAGLPSILMPTIMQRKGRKIAFVICCLLIITGWILTYFAHNAATIIVGESFHGLGTNSIIIVSFFTISEMVDPKFRIISMSFYMVNESVGTALICIMGRFIHWKTVSLVMIAPILIALLIGCMWPESPSWLAWKGEFEKCEEAFVWLRGTDADAKKELNALINAQKEREHSMSRKKLNERWFRDLWLQINRKDFYLPCLHMFICLSMFYFSGTLVVLIYAMDMIRKTTGSETAAFYGMIVIDLILALGTFISLILMKVLKNKTVLLYCGMVTTVCLFLACLFSFLQRLGMLPNDSLLCLYCLIGYMVACSTGTVTLSFTVSAELVPVKHRDLGGALYVIVICLQHFASLKISPYLMFYLNLWGTLLIFTLNALFCTWFIHKYVPETKNRTLQEIEDYYNHGHFVNRYSSGDVEDDVPIGKVNNEK